MEPRIPPQPGPYATDMQETLARLMPEGVEPLLLFRVLARDERLFRRFMAGGLLDRGNLTLRERELAILRSCGLCHAEYEWGVHVAVFAARVGFDAAQLRATLAPAPAPVDAGFDAREMLIVRLIEALHQHADVEDALWAELREAFGPEQLIELIMLAGLYRMVSYLVNALRLPAEAFGARFEDVTAARVNEPATGSSR